MYASIHLSMYACADVPCRHDMVKVYALDKGLDFGSLKDLLFVHGPGHLPGVSGDTGNWNTHIQKTHQNK